MAYDNRRPDRVAEAIREEVARFLADGLKDPRVRGLVTVTGADITRDLRHARIYVSIMGTEEERTETFSVLEGVAAHLRGRIGRALRLRVAPDIAFKHDASVAHAARIETLLEQIRREGEGSAADASAADAPAGDAPASDAPSGAPSDAPAGEPSRD
jgi:ribosome-binding factor A